MTKDYVPYGLEYEVECLAASQRVNDREAILKRLREINRSIIPCVSDRAERIYKKLSDAYLSFSG